MASSKTDKSSLGISKRNYKHVTFSFVHDVKESFKLFEESGEHTDRFRHIQSFLNETEQNGNKVLSLSVSIG